MTAKLYKFPSKKKKRLFDEANEYGMSLLNRAFEEYEENKRKAASELKMVASKLYQLAISEKQIAKVVADVYRQLEEEGGDNEIEQ